MKNDLGMQVLTNNKSPDRYLFELRMVFFLRMKYNSIAIRVSIVIK